MSLKLNPKGLLMSMKIGLKVGRKSVVLMGPRSLPWCKSIHHSSENTHSYEYTDHHFCICIKYSNNINQPYTNGCDYDSLVWEMAQASQPGSTRSFSMCIESDTFPLAWIRYASLFKQWHVFSFFPDKNYGPTCRLFVYSPAIWGLAGVDDHALNVKTAWCVETCSS